MTSAREAVEAVVKEARANGVYINEAAIDRSIAKLGDDRVMIAQFIEAGMQLARGETVLVEFWA